MAMIPIFTLKLDRGIQAKGVTVGTYDGIHPSLTCATDAGKVFHGNHVLLCIFCDYFFSSDYFYYNGDNDDDDVYVYSDYSYEI